MRKLYFIPVIFFFLHIAQVKAQMNTFVRSLGFEAELIEPRGNGYYVLGEGYNGEIIYMRTDAAGNPVWSKQYTSLMTGQLNMAAASMSSDGFIIASNLAWCGSCINNITLVQIDTTGAVQWSKELSFTNSSITDVSDIIYLSDNGFLVSGTSNDTVSGYSSTFIIRMDSLANVIWSRTVPWIEQSYLLQDSNDFFIAGTEMFEEHTMYLLKLDAAGNLVWCNGFGGIGEGVTAAGKPVRSGSNYFVPINHFEVVGPYVEDDIGAVKIDAATGTIARVVRYSEPYTGELRDMERTPDNQLVMCGYTVRSEFGFVQQPLLLKVDSMLNVTWSRVEAMQYGGVANDVIVHPSGGYAAAGNPMFKTDAAGQTCLDTTFAYPVIVIDMIQDTIWMPLGIRTAVISPLTVSVASITSQSTLHCITGIEDEYLSEIVNLYPNPNDGRFMISIPQTNNNIILTIYNLLGEVVHTRSVQNPEEIEIEWLRSGVYLLRISGSNGINYVQRVVVR